MTGSLAIEVPPTVATEIEALAMRAWPAEVVAPLGGWRLAFTPGLTTRRINSVQALGWRNEIGVDQALARVEALYAARSLPARFRLTALSRPPELDARLAERGYTIEAPTAVMVADLAAVAAAPGTDDAILASRPPPDWRRLWLTGSADDDPRARVALLARLPAGTLFGLMRSDSAAAALGLLVPEGGWGGVFGMRTEQRFRHRGLAKALLAALAREARRRGAAQLYLQVEQDNAPALALYHGAGFTPAYGYHYRTRHPATG